MRSGRREHELANRSGGDRRGKKTKKSGPLPGTANLIFIWLLLFTAFSAEVCGAAEDRRTVENVPSTPEGIYLYACAACHGKDGAGAPKSRLGAVAPVPDFTDCDFATREADLDWIAVAHLGGPARAFRKMMPSFRDALTREQIALALQHIRTFCTNSAWPRGELNLPRPLVTTKAYPEDEVVFEIGYDGAGLERLSAELIYEQRFGARNQFEIAIPFGWREMETESNGLSDTTWESSLGDIVLGVKRAIYHNLDSGSIISMAAEFLLPTGDVDEGFGSDTTIFEPYVAYGQIFPADFFLQFQGGFALPFDDDKASEEAFWRFALGHQYYEGGYGRRWTPIIELAGAKELISDADTDWDIIPQMQVTLSTRQHVRFNMGVRLPLNNTDVRDAEVMAYLLWDWFDGSIFSGW